MDYGVLHILIPGEPETFFPILTTTFVAGRGDTCELLLEYATVSRRHARFSVQNGSFFVEDLGSSNGTFLEGQRLPPYVPVDIGELPVKLGLIEVFYESPLRVEQPAVQQPVFEPVEPEAAPEPEPEDESLAVTQAVRRHGTEPLPALPVVPEAPNFSLSVRGPEEPVMPGDCVDAVLRVENIGTVLAKIDLACSGVPQSWIALDDVFMELQPGEVRQTLIHLQPERSPKSAAASYRLDISGSAGEIMAVTNTSLVVLPVYAFEMSLQPEIGRRSFQLLARNNSNVTSSYRLRGEDAAHMLDFQLGAVNLQLAPGQASAVPVTVKLRSGIKPPVESVPFVLVASPVQEGNEARVQGRLLPRSRLMLGWMILAAFLLISLGAGLMYGYLQVCPGLGANLPLCSPVVGSTPQILLFSATASEVKTGQEVLVVWRVVGADRVALIQPEQRELPSSGNFSYKVQTPTVFLLEVSNAAGTTTQTFTVQVKP